MRRNLFLRYFPAPEFLKMPAVGINITDNSIYFVELLDTEKGKRLKSFGFKELPQGVVSKGKVIKKEKLVEILKLVKEKCDFDFVKSSVAENDSYIFKTKILKTSNEMTKEEIFAELSFKIEENVPMKLEDVVFDFDILKEDEHHLELIVSVLSAGIIDSFTEAFVEAGFQPIFFEVEPQAIARSAISENDNGTFMIVDFRRFRTGISVVSGGVVQFTTTLDIGEENLISAVEKYLKVSRKKAIEVIKEKGFVKRNLDIDFFYSLLGTVAALKDEINKYLVYWHSRHNKKGSKTKAKVSKILLCGSGGSIKGVDDFLSLGVGLNVEKINIWKNIFSLDDFIPDMEYLESLKYVAAVGLAMSSDDIVFSTKKM